MPVSVPRHISTTTSLPPLQTYGQTGVKRRRWGEEERLPELDCDLIKDGCSKWRMNFDSCHPVAEKVGDKYEGYMFPKPMTTDLSFLRAAPMNTRRRPDGPVVKSDVFPRNNDARIGNDGLPVLSANTRTAIDTFVTRWHRTSRYDNIFQDNIAFMTEKLKRDAQYAVEGPDYEEAQTCCRVLNHPDPCRHCWPGAAGPYPPSSAARPPTSQANLHGTGKPQADSSLALTQNEKTNTTEQPFDWRDEIVAVPETDLVSSKAGRKRNVKIIAPTKNELLKQQERSESMCKHCLECGQCNKCSSFKDTPTADPNMDSFGPLTDAPVPGDENSIIASKRLCTDIYNFKIPSSLHCRTTENALATRYEERRSKTFQTKDGITSYNMDPWISLCRSKQPAHRSPPSGATIGETRVVVDPTSVSNVGRRPNRWTFRDEENLRVPCITDVIGTFDKTAAHKRYHRLYMDPIPDTRDFQCSSKRNTFYGYNSCVFR